jgi:hypothetical protein
MYGIDGSLDEIMKCFNEIKILQIEIVKSRLWEITK